jgi:hypothetical protein
MTDCGSASSSGLICGTLHDSLKERAEPLARRALQTKERRLGAIHPDIGLALGNLAVSLRALGQGNEAEVCGRRAVSILEKSLGLAHPATLARREAYVLLAVPASARSQRPASSRASAASRARPSSKTASKAAPPRLS